MKEGLSGLLQSFQSSLEHWIRNEKRMWEGKSVEAEGMFESLVGKCFGKLFVQHWKEEPGLKTQAKRVAEMTLPEKGSGGQASKELPDVSVRREIKNPVPFLGMLFGLAGAGITLCTWSLVKQMWLFTIKSLKDQDYCALASLLDGTM